MPSPSLTPEQLQQAVDAVAEAGTVTGAARAINMNRATLEGRLREAKRLGFAPKTAPPPPPENVKQIFMQKGCVGCHKISGFQEALGVTAEIQPRRHADIID